MVSNQEYDPLPESSGWATLRAVVERGGVSGAAAALNIGQPAVTKRLRALEAVYGVAIMERLGGRLRLTEAGERVYRLAVQVLDHNRAVHEELRWLAAGQTSMRLEVSMAIGEHLLPELLLRFHERWPEYRVLTRVGYGRRIQADLAAGLADLALIEEAPDHPEILVQPWMEDELWLVCGPEHPLAGRGLLEVDEMAALRYVLRERRSAIRDALERALAGIGVTQVEIALEVGSNDAIVEMLKRGALVSFMPRFAVREPVRRGELHRLKVRGFRILRTLWICRHRAKLGLPVAETFVELLREEAP